MNIGNWELDSVQNVDALELTRGLPDNSIDLIVTSPPYDNLRTYNGYSFDFEPIAQDSYRVLKQGGVLVWVVGDSVVNGSETLTSFKQALYFVECGFRMHDTMIWNKYLAGVYGKRYVHAFEYMFILSKGEPSTFNPAVQRKNQFMGGHGASSRKATGSVNDGRMFVTSQYSLAENVWRIPVGGGVTSRDGTKHPAAFPEALAERHILTWSNAGDVVLDYFGGSGTTAKMARNNGRHWLTGDISAEYCELMRRRLAMPYTMPMFAQEATP